MIDLWIDEKNRRIETDKNWAELRIKTDKDSGEQYIDVLIGSRDNPNAKSHMGWNLDQSLRFDAFRDRVKAVNRKVVSKKYGLLEDETVNINNGLKDTVDVIFRFIIEEANGEVIIKEFRFE